MKSFDFLWYLKNELNNGEKSAKEEIWREPGQYRIRSSSTSNIYRLCYQLVKM